MNNFPLNVTDSKGRSHDFVAAALPDECPCCHKGIEPKFRFGFVGDEEHPTVKNLSVQAIFHCPRRECQRLFIADYEQVKEHHSRDERLRLRCLSPLWLEKKIFPDPIEECSSSFCQIFDEAARAQSLGLLNAAGPAYRKALEFLVKDYLILQEPNDADAIKKMTLQNAIQNKIKDENIKECAERATWLGNDETHYERIWKSHDLDDLKGLIIVTVNWVHNHLLTQKHKKAMQKLRK